MVGEQESRTSGTERSGTASVPQSYRWKRIQNMNARSRLQEVSGSLNCAEKFSLLVSCHRGYGSVAFYAVFSLFIVTFLYTIWKIVSAHSRSARRPGSSNSTSPTVLSPTAHAPTDYASAHEWIKTGNILDHFHQSVKNLRPFPQRKPSPTVYYPPENKERDKISSVNNNVDYPTRGNVIVGSPYPAWTSSGGATKSFYDYYPGSLNTVQPPVNYPSFTRLPYPTVPSPTLPYPTAFNPYLPVGVNSNQRLPFGAKASNLIPYNSNSMGIYNENAALLSSPSANISYRAPYYFPTNKNTLPQSFYDNLYYGDNAFQNADRGTQTSPSPLISFLSESSHDANKSRHHFKKRRKKRKKSRKVTKRNKKKRNHSRKHIEYEYIEDIDEKNNSNEKKARSTKHRQANGNRKAFKNHRKKYHEEKINKDHHYFKTTGNKQFKPNPRKYKRTHISAKGHVQHQARKNLKIYKKLRFITHKPKRTSIPHPQKRARASYPKRWDHDNHIQHFRRQKHFRALHASHRRQHNFFNFKLYRRYRKHHTVNDEIHGKWKISRHRVRTCKLISQFSTQGTVKITRASGHNRRFLHTLLICRPVRLRVRRGHHRQRYSLKYAQLCSKKWYVTKGVIHVHKASSNDQDEIPRYNVRICEPSYAHAMKLVSAEGKDTKVWSISEQFVRKMEIEDTKKFSVKSVSLKNGHKHNHRKGKLIHKKKKIKVKARERGVTRNKWTSGHHTHKTATKKRNRHHESKAANHDNKRKLKKSHDNKKAKHDRKKKLASGNKKNDSAGKTKGLIVNSDKLFYRKLLKVLKLAKMRDRKKANSTTNNDVFDSLEAVLVQSQSETKNSSPGKNNTKTELTVKKNKMTKQKASKKESPKHAQRIQGKSNNNTIQKLLAKILPAVIEIINGDANAGKSAITTVTTKPTKPATTQKTSTSTTPTSKTPTLKTNSNDNNIENIMKNILPLLLKRAGKAQGNPRLKSKPKEHKPRRPLPSKQRTSQPKRTADKSGLTSILASLGLGNLASNSLRNTISAKETVVTNKLTLKPTKRSTVAHLKTTLLPKIPLQPPITRSTPTPSMTTMQPPPSLTHPDTPAVQSISIPAISQMSPVGLPPGPVSAPSSVQIPATHQGSPAISTLVSPLQSAVSPRVINSDPYSRSILCFGDSLTSGYYNHGHNFHPYSQRLGQLLNSEGRIKYYVKTSGKVREMAHGSMARRLPEVLGNSSRFDWVIILGGTNDVAHVKNFGDDDSFMSQLISIWKPRIVRDIEVLHEIAHRYGARTVLLTIPETAYEAWPNYKTLWVMRNRLNEDLRDYARRSHGSVVLCDLANQLPRHSLSLQAQSILWNDHLHLTPYGYDRMAEIVYQCLKPYLNS